jgi:phosphoadenosine phosphosulfate reductase
MGLSEMKGGEASGKNEEKRKESSRGSDQSVCGQIGRIGRPRRRAVTEADALRARLVGFRALESRTLECIERAAKIGSIGVSFSGGKDSTVLLDLVRRVDPKAKAVFIDSGAELDSTLALIEQYECETVFPETNIIQAAKIAGWWGYPNPSMPGARIDLKGLLIIDPAEKWHKANGIAVSAIGLRAQESLARELDAHTHGEIFHTKSGIVRLCPLLRWRVDDIWTYIAARELNYNAAYDAMTALGVDRNDQRVGTNLGDTNFSRGRMTYLKYCEPNTFNRLAAEFPAMRAYA